MDNSIVFSEGMLHIVEISIPSEFSLVEKRIVIDVRRDTNTSIKLRFDSDDDSGLLIRNGQNLLLTIPAFMSVGISGNYKWQMIIFTNESDGVLSEIYDFKINPSVAKMAIS